MAMHNFLFFILIFLSQLAFAQNGLHIGAKGFGGSSFILFQHSTDLMAKVPETSLSNGELAYNMKFGYFLGGSALYNFKRNAGIQADVLYFNGGQSYGDEFCKTSCAQRYEVTKKVVLAQIQIPLMFKYTMGNEEIYKIYIMGGPSFGITIAGREEGSIKVYRNNNAAGGGADSFLYEIPYQNADILQKVKSFDLGFVAEAGVNFYFSKKLYANIGLNAGISILDINTSNVKDQEIAANKSYKGSYFTKMGITAGVHYVVFGHNRSLRWRKGGF
jgi:hypothetical protein